MPTRAAVVLPLAAALLAALAAEAEARSRHERVQVAPLVKKGETVGVRIKLTLRPEDYGHDRVRVGISPGGKAGDSDYRTKASDPKKGHLLHQWPEIKGLKTNQPQEVTLEVRYEDAPGLTPGSKFELVSAWSDSSRTHWHIWGLTTNISGPVEKHTLPGTPRPRTATARKPRASSRASAAAPRKPRASSRASAAAPRKPRASSRASAAAPRKPRASSRTSASSSRASRTPAAATRTPRKPAARGTTSAASAGARRGSAAAGSRAAATRGRTRAAPRIR